jgi:hypothetical protein
MVRTGCCTPGRSTPGCATAAACTTCAPCWPPQAATFRHSTWRPAAPAWPPRPPEPLLDAPARGAYRRRIRELDGELAAADRAGNITGAERAHTERQALIKELRRATGLAGRPRRAAADTERARVNVTRTIRAAIDRITLAAPIAGAHLQSSIHTGTACRYQPAPGGPARWHT